MPIDSVKIPMFPLRTFMLPGEQMPLCVFEPKYRQLFDEIEEDDLHFAMPYKEHNVRWASKCKLVRVTERTPKGTRDVIVECVSVHKLISSVDRMKDKLYPCGKIGENLVVGKRERASVRLLESFADYIEIKFGKRPILGEIIHYKPMDVAACIAMSNWDKIRFIQLPNSKAREGMLFGLLKYLHFLYFQEAQAEKGILLN